MIEILQPKRYLAGRFEFCVCRLYAIKSLLLNDLSLDRRPCDRHSTAILSTEGKNDDSIKNREVDLRTLLGIAQYRVGVAKFKNMTPSALNGKEGAEPVGE